MEPALAFWGTQIFRPIWKPSLLHNALCWMVLPLMPGKEKKNYIFPSMQPSVKLHPLLEVFLKYPSLLYFPIFYFIIIIFLISKSRVTGWNVFHTWSIFHLCRRKPLSCFRLYQKDERPTEVKPLWAWRQQSWMKWTNWFSKFIHKPFWCSRYQITWLWMVSYLEMAKVNRIIYRLRQSVHQ